MEREERAILSLAGMVLLDGFQAYVHGDVSGLISCIWPPANVEKKPWLPRNQSRGTAGTGGL